MGRACYKLRDIFAKYPAKRFLDESCKRSLLREWYGEAFAEVGPGALSDFEFCRYYAKRLGNSLMERLKHEVYEVLEQAVNW